MHSVFSTLSSIFIVIGLNRGFALNIIAIAMSFVALILKLISFDSSFVDWFFVVSQTISFVCNGVIIGIKATR